MPNNERKIARVCAAKRITCQVAVNGLKLTLRPGSVASARGMKREHRYVPTATTTMATAATMFASLPPAARLAVAVGREQAARDRADENGDEGAGVHQRVAADQFALAAGAAASANT